MCSKEVVVGARVTAECKRKKERSERVQSRSSMDAPAQVSLACDNHGVAAQAHGSSGSEARSNQGVRRNNRYERGVAQI